MKSNQASSTAYLIAESNVFLSKNKKLKNLTSAKSIEFNKYFADSRPFLQKITYFAKQKTFLRPFFNALEYLTIPGIQLHYLLRKRRIEEITLEALSDGFQQIVILGAGFDTLALRLHREFPNVNFVEIDHPNTQNAKQDVVKKQNLAQNNLKFISADFNDPNLFNRLLTNNLLKTDAKTLFIAEGLLMYLDETIIEDIFTFIFNQNAIGNRFAFTFMESQNNGKIAFRNSSRFVDFWLKMKGEPFKWGLNKSEITKFAEEKDLSILSLNNSESFRQKYLITAELVGLKLAEGESLCLVEKKKKIFVNDIHSKLNQTEVAEIIKPNSLSDIKAAIIKSKSENKFVSIAGGFHAMGGQQFLSGGILLDMSGMDQVLKFESENKLITVESGIKWNELIKYLVSEQTGRQDQVGIRQKQTGADNLSIGGALSANIHGRGLTMKPLIDDVESFRIITADGETLTCSRQENSELFCLAIGGYGLFGIIVTVMLRLSKRELVKRVVRIDNIENLNSLFNKRIAEGFKFGDFQFAINPESKDFLRKGVFSCYLPIQENIDLDEVQKELSADDWKSLLLLAHTDKQRAFELYCSHYLQTDEQIYWSDTHQLSIYLDDYHLELDQKLNAENPSSEMITEIYVPLEKLSDFMAVVQKDFQKHKTNLIYGTVRLIKADDESFLAWAKQDWACIVFNLHVEHSENGIEKAKIEFRNLIKRAIEFGGNFYLTYHRWATKEQILTCYPQIQEFLRLKRKYDEKEIFQSNWYQHWKKTLL